MRIHKGENGICAAEPLWFLKQQLHLAQGRVQRIIRAFVTICLQWYPMNTRSRHVMAVSDKAFLPVPPGVHATCEEKRL